MHYIHSHYDNITNMNNESIFVDPSNKLINIRYELSDFWKELYEKAKVDKKIF
jgi:hypothetical protein